MTDLNGATTAPPPGVRISTAGEFAAAWNALNEAQRQARVDVLMAAMDRSYECVIEDHEGLMENMRTLPAAIARVSALAHEWVKGKESAHYGREVIAALKEPPTLSERAHVGQDR